MAAVLAIGIFAVLAILVAVHPEPFGVDRAAARFASSVRTGPVTAAMRTVSVLGSFPAIALQIAVIGGAILLARRDPRPGLWMLAAAVGAWILSNSFKALLDRPRPEPGLVDADGAAFPSGHATQGTAYFLMLAVVLAVTLPRPWRVPAATLALAIGILSGLSRIYLGVHWATDVAGGFALGLAWTLGLLALRRDRFEPGVPAEPAAM
jgi:membrane-associated phospholipid phosphatase